MKMVNQGGVNPTDGVEQDIDKIRGVVLGIVNRGLGSSVLIRDVVYGLPIERKIPLHSPMVKDLKILERNFVFKGKSEALKTYQPMNPAEYEAQSTKKYNEAYALLEAGDQSARQAFASLVGEFGEDPLTMFHLGRLLAGESGTEIELQSK